MLNFVILKNQGFYVMLSFKPRCFYVLNRQRIQEIPNSKLAGLTDYVYEVQFCYCMLFVIYFPDVHTNNTYVHFDN
jgi:hypothetical protein